MLAQFIRSCGKASNGIVCHFANFPNSGGGGFFALAGAKRAGGVMRNNSSTQHRRGCTTYPWIQFRSSRRSTSSDHHGCEVSMSRLCVMSIMYVSTLPRFLSEASNTMPWQKEFIITFCTYCAVTAVFLPVTSFPTAIFRLSSLNFRHRGCMSEL
jgi:hypothetical protein